MKKAIITTICIFLINSSCYSVDTTTGQIQKLEKSYFGYDYPSETNTKRLERLEKAVYGTISQAPPATRIQKLSKDLQLSAAPPQTGQGQQIASAPAEQLPPAEKDVKYPIVDKIEQKVFKKSYTGEDIYVRLSRLEKQVYKKENSGSLNDRVDSLRASTLGNSSVVDTESIALDGYDPSMTGAATDFPDPDSNGNQYNYYSPQNTKNRIAKPDTTGYGSSSAKNYAQGYDLDMLEKSVLGQKFQGESESRRLARLENSVFQKTFSDDSDARVQRLLAATTAQKTSKHYDNNKLMQRLNTGIQIGGILLMVLAMIL